MNDGMKNNGSVCVVWTETEEGQPMGVEAMLEQLREPLKVVFTVALDEVKKLCVHDGPRAMHKEVKALLDAGALVPLTTREQTQLEASGRVGCVAGKGRLYSEASRRRNAWRMIKVPRYLRDRFTLSSARPVWLYVVIFRGDRHVKTPMLEDVRSTAYGRC